MKLSKSFNKGIIITIAAALFFLVLPTFMRSGFILNVLILCFIWAGVVVSWDLIFGVAGVFSFGAVAFFTIGAYASAIITMKTGISPWIGMILGGIVSAIIGIIIGIPCLRLKGFYIAIVTFSLHLSLTPLIYIGKPIGTNGVTSLTGIPLLRFGNYIFDSMDRRAFYYAALIVSSIVIILVYRIIKSSYGVAFKALRDSEDFAKSLGVNEYRYKLIVFGMSSFFIGVMGGFYAHYNGLISHHLLDLSLIVLLFVILIVGGVGKFPGAIVATFIFVFLNEYARPLEQYRSLLWGAVVILVVILMPGGILSIFKLKKASGLQKNNH